MERNRPLPRGRLGVLGVVTIGAYGAWFYAYGVLLDPIIEDTGWSEAALAGTYALSLLLGGIGGLGGGWLLDRFGSRLVFAVGAALTMSAFVVAASAESVAVFTTAGALAGGSLAALAFYHVTQTVAVRIAPDSPNRAIAVLTIWGAFASVLAIPASAWLEVRFGWRTTLVVLGSFAAASLLAAAATVPTAGAPAVRSSFTAIRARLGNAHVRRFLVAQAVGGMTASVIIVYQVPAMTSAGLSIGVASTVGGFRGLAQLGGRLPLAPLVAAIGVGRSMQLAYVVLAIGAVLLSVAGSLLPAVLFAICAGFGIGALSALAGMYTAEVFDADSLGTAMGFTSLVFGAVGAAGPALAGWTAEVSGSRAWPVLGAAALSALAAAVIKPVPR